MTSSSTMAADSPIDPAQAKFLTSVFTWMAGVATATIGAVGLWLAQRMVGKAAFEQAMNARFQVLMDQTSAFHASERASWQAERLQLRGEIVNLKQIVATLTDSLRRQGVQGLPDAEHPDPLITLHSEDEPS